MENADEKKSIIEKIQSSFSRTVEKELEDGIEFDDRVMSIAIVVFGVLIGLYFVAHQTGSTGFFTTTFGALEMFLLYGTLIYWIVVSVLLLKPFNRKNLSRNIDSFGGLIFATVSFTWLLVVFPFEFAYFADVLQPEFLRFLVQWISNDIARVLMILVIIVHLGLAVFSVIIRVSVYKARARKE
jgi:hypothetical protein